MSEADLNRLRWRCQRGMLELDQILKGFLDREYAEAAPEIRKAFEDLLAREDADLYDLLLGQARAGSETEARLLTLLRGR